MPTANKNVAGDKLARVAAGAGLDTSPVPAPGHWLFGRDLSDRIVSVDADQHGRARVWRRTGPLRIEYAEHRFHNWFLATTLEPLAHLPRQHLTAAEVRDAQGELALDDGLAVVDLASGTTHEDAYDYLVLTDRLAEVETILVETSNKRDGGEAQSLADLRGLVLVWPPVEQFLLLTGRTYFGGMEFADLRRLQFDLETTGLNDERDRIFMISLRDSTGWTACLDTESLSEAQLIEQFVQLIQQRDPDVLENHNIFAFDLPFLVRRAARVGVPLSLGRDGSEPELETDVFDNGERGEPFLRWRVRGREVVDTQHAVRRYGLAAPDLRRHGLKDAARYFGFAKSDREYVPGAEIWTTYQSDPERVRRYAADDVDEVDGLSRRLLPGAFELAQMVPRAYERIAADAGAMSLWEPLLVRAYLHEGRAVPAPTPRLQRMAESRRADLQIRGVVGPAVRATLKPLLPSVIVSGRLTAANDEMAVMASVLSTLLSSAPQSGQRVLVDSSYSYLAGQGLFSDPAAATTAWQRARSLVDHVLDELRAHGCSIVEVDGEQVLFGCPPDWNDEVERAIAERGAAVLPTGVRLEFEGHYAAAYVRAPHSSILLEADGSVTLIGTSFRPGRLERYGESFIRHAAARILAGDHVGARQLFLDTVNALRAAELPLEDLCVQVTLHKSPAQYRRGGTHEEPYEVLLDAGVRSWRVGQRIRYFRARGGEPRLLQEGDLTPTHEADSEYYEQRLLSLYCQQFAHAYLPADFARVFRLPGVADDDDVSDVQTVAEHLPAPV